MNDRMTNGSIAKNQRERIELLLERTKYFARDGRLFVRALPRTSSNIEDGKQLIRSTGSVAAKTIETDEALSRKDFVMRAKIVRKEAKESALWLELVDVGDDAKLEAERHRLFNEANELKLIYNAIIVKAESRH